MTKWTKYIFGGLFFLILCGGFVSTLNADLTVISGEFPEITLVADQTQNNKHSAEDDTTLHFPVTPAIIPEEYKDITNTYPLDLRNPENLNNGFQYNPLTNRYELRSKIGDLDISTPLSLTPDEYLEYTFQKSMNSYFKARNDETFSTQNDPEKDALSMFDFKFDLGPAEKIFGPGGVRLQAQGGATIKMGIANNKTSDPTLSERQRNRTSFDFDTEIQTNITASVGDKINFDLNYNTESTFDFDTKKIKLGYEGKEDEIIKVLEAGNVSMNTTNSLIRGGVSLFGIKTQLQFGNLTVDAVFSQQESQSRTTSSRGNIQTTPFEVTVDSYDENMHFFLAHYFHDTYDAAMSTLPYIRSGIRIDHLEVWVTNKRSNFNQARNIVAFADLGEYEHIGDNTGFVVPNRSEAPIPDNNANTLYYKINTNYPNVRNIGSVNQALEGVLEGGRDYEKIENARKLELNEYIFNSQLGYISLRTPLQTDEVLAVAFDYTYKGEVYTVGELSTSRSDKPSENLYLKLLKGTSLSPASINWHLMMRNVYTISNRGIEKDKFRLDIKYQNDTTGVYLNYITEGAIANKLLLRVENLDRLDAREEPYSDGFFDYVEGYTAISQYGKIIFPVVEPFGKHLRKKIGIDSIADKYVYQELYDSTLTVARQTAEKNKFILQGEYKGTGGSNIELDGYNIARGSVIVTANGKQLVENVDYRVNGTGVDIINPIYENANIEVSSEDRSTFGMQRKTMMGLNLNYAISPKFNIGGTIMNLSEMPLTLKTNPGEESINNTLFGFNTNYSTSSYWLTNLLDKLPFIELTAPSQITMNAEFAQLIPNHYKSRYGGDYSYIDDFEKAKMTVDLRSPYPWNLSATPVANAFPEAKEVNKLEYGKNRALLAWYYIDGLFTRKSSLTPTHIKNDENQLSNHYVREIREDELFPNKDQRYNESATVPVLNLAFYPKERGPYNIVAEEMNPDGTLSNPEKRWGGIFRKIDSGNTDFDANNIEHIEFWLLDPFINNPNAKGGDLYFNLGEISEDILKDEKKFFENGLPANGDTTKVEQTVWGVVPTQQSLVYAFDNSTPGSRQKQDVGLDGLRNEDEYKHASYSNYLNELRRRLNPETINRMEQDPFSPLNDPAGDNYHYFRGSDYDRQEMSILGRYKHYNGTEGNSADTQDSPESYATSAQVSPDVEDINQDNTLNENEKYFQYKVSICPDSLGIGKNKYIVDKRETSPLLKNGKTETVSWYLFKIPIRDIDPNTSAIGGIRDFSSIRFIRMYLTNFVDSTILRFGTLELVKGDWRTYTKDLSNPSLPLNGNATINISTINIEENGDKIPVNYIMPPGVNRMMDPTQPQLRMQNEQSLVLRVDNLSQGDARAIYKNTGLDTRQYKRLQMFAHAEKFAGDMSVFNDNEMSIFLRFGSDYKNNYYEYEIPLKLTPPGIYSPVNTSDKETVWPQANMFDFPFELLTNLKLKRNKEKRKEGSNVTYYTPYSEYDPQKPMNKITVMGNPSISEIKIIMVGVRNNSNSVKSVEVWADELRLTDFSEDGGWAGNTNLFVGLSDLGAINFSGRKETAGFGSLDQGLMERNLEDKQAISFSAQLDMGKFFPEKAKVNLPVYYSYTEELMSPKYNPLDQDILLKDALDAVDTSAEKDSIKGFAQDKITNKTFDMNNIRVNINSEKAMPYDPANFTFAYSFAERNVQNATTQYERQTDTRFSFNYNYSPMLKPWQPFDHKSKENAKENQKNPENSATKRSATTNNKSKPNFFKDISIGLLPKNLNINSDISRNYFELQLRDIGNLGENMLPASFREDFYWARDLGLQWDLTKNLNLTLNTGTNARVDAPHVQVNKKFNYDDYELWKDTIKNSIENWGTPMDYRQQFVARYSIPFKNIPYFDFITAGLSFSSTYDWQRGASIALPEEEEMPEPEDIEMGNIIKNSRTLGLDNVNINLLNFYNKIKFFENVNKKYSLNKSTPRNNSNNKQTNTDREKNQKADDENLKKKYEGSIHLNPDSSTLVVHALGNKRIRLIARGTNGRLYELKYKKLDVNSIEIKNQDTVALNLVITQLPPLEDESWYKIAEIAARGVMTLRTIGFSYTETSGMMIPSFRPEVGDFFGQNSSPFGPTPGLDFAFGFTGESYLDKANQNDWLIKNADNVNPAAFNQTETFNLTALLEPFNGMKINLNALRNNSRQSQSFFMFDDVYKRFSGDFYMTTIALRSSFETSNANNGYYSNAFNDFLKNRAVIADRLEKKYIGTTYPDAGFIKGSNYAGDTYKGGEININSTDVLIPAFFAAYLGQDPGNTNLSLLPTLKSILPNWKLTYEGFIQLPIIKKYFKSFVVDHEYKCRYSVGAYSSNATWVDAGGGIGFIRNMTTDAPFPSTPYEITAVSIQEAFDPLLRINSVFLNNMSLKVEYKTLRNINLNVSAYQIVENSTTDFGVGTGYRIENFNKILRLPKTGGQNFNNELKVSADMSFREGKNLIRKIDNADTQATEGNSQIILKLTADYSMSKMVTFQAFFDRQISKPLVSSTSFPLTKTNFGISLKINLAR